MLTVSMPQTSDCRVGQSVSCSDETYGKACSRQLFCFGHALFTAVIDGRTISFIDSANFGVWDEVPPLLRNPARGTFRIFAA